MELRKIGANFVKLGKFGNYLMLKTFQNLGKNYAKILGCDSSVPNITKASQVTLLITVKKLLYQ